jgi:MFS family permease
LPQHQSTEPSKIQTIISHPLTISFYLPSLLYAFCTGLLIPILPLYAADFEISYGLIGVVLAAELIGLAVGDIPAGLLVQRFGIKRVMVLGIGVVSIAVGALFWMQTIWLVIICRLLSGFSLALFNVSRHVYLAETLKLETRGRFIAVLGGVRRAGMFTGPAVGGIVATQYGLRAPFFLFMIICLVAFFTIIIFLNVETPATSNKVHVPQVSVLSTLRLHYYVLMTAGGGFLFAMMIRHGSKVVIPLYGANVLGLSAQEIGFIVSISSAVDMMLFYPAGWVMDNLGRKYAIVPSFFGQGIGLALIPFAVNAWGLLIAGCIVGLANGLSSGSMMTLSSDLAPEDARGNFLGIWSLIGDAGSAGSPLIVGVVADLFSLHPSIWVIALAGFCASGLFAFFVPETLKQKRKIHQ